MAACPCCREPLRDTLQEIGVNPKTRSWPADQDKEPHRKPPRVLLGTSIFSIFLCQSLEFRAAEIGSQSIMPHSMYPWRLSFPHMLCFTILQAAEPIATATSTTRLCLNDAMQNGVIRPTPSTNFLQLEPLLRPIWGAVAVHWGPLGGLGGWGGLVLLHI